MHLFRASPLVQHPFLLLFHVQELKQSSTFDGDTSRSGGASPRGGSPSLPAREAAAPAVIEARCHISLSDAHNHLPLQGVPALDVIRWISSDAGACLQQGRDEEDVTSLLQMENARLRAEVAKLVAMACVAEQKSLTAAATPVAAAVPSLPRCPLKRQLLMCKHPEGVAAMCAQSDVPSPLTHN